MEKTILNIIKYIIIMPTLIVEMIIKAIYNALYFIIVVFICTIYPIIKKYSPLDIIAQTKPYKSFTSNYYIVKAIDQLW